MVEAYSIKVTTSQLKEAINGFSPSERRATAAFFIYVINGSPNLFDTNMGRVSETGAEVWIPDPNTNDKHYISVSTEAKGRLRYERVRQGRILQESSDRSATRSIRDVLTDIGVLILVED